MENYEKKVPKYRAALDDPKLRNMYIIQITQHGDKNIAAAAVNLHPSTVSKYCQNNPDFADRIVRAEYKWRATLMKAMMEQGVHGVEEPILHHGEIVGYRRKVQPRILELLVKKAMPEFNPTRVVEHNHSGQIENSSNELVSNLSIDEKRELLKFLRSKNVDTKADNVSFDVQKKDIPNHVLTQELNPENYIIPPDQVTLTEQDLENLNYKKKE